MQINALITSSEVRRSWNLAISENSNTLGKKYTRFFRIDVFAFPRHKINRNDPDENIYLEFMAFCSQFLKLKITKNGSVSKTLLLQLQMQ